jgi:hypothetical protein
MPLCSVVEKEEATFTRKHGVTFQKAGIFTFTAMRISELKKIVFIIDVKNLLNIFVLQDLSSVPDRGPSMQHER